MVLKRFEPRLFKRGGVKGDQIVKKKIELIIQIYSHLIVLNEGRTR